MIWVPEKTYPYLLLQTIVCYFLWGTPLLSYIHVIICHN